MSHVTQKELDIRVICLETEDGHVGWGEIVRRATLDPIKVAPQEEPLLEAMAGRDVADIPAFVRELGRRDKAFRGLAFGLDTAYLDLVARRIELPLYALLGGKLVDDVPEYYSLSCGDAESVAPKLAVEATGFGIVQIKLGAGDRQADRERIRAALEALAENQTILADFNGALNVETAMAVFSEFDDPRIVWEEPCNTVEANTEVARRTGLPVMFDQCLEGLDLITQVVADGVAHSVCLKPAFLGGLEVARTARDICIAAQMPMRIDGPWCGHIATAASLHLAVGVPSELLVAGCDLRQPLSLNEDWGGTQHFPDHRIAPSDTPGHGAAPV